MRIGIIGFLHESNTFVNTKTTLKDFEASHLHFDDEILKEWEGTHHEIGGFLEGAVQYNFEPVPIIVAIAMPSGPLTTETFEWIWNKIQEGLKKVGDLDGILLALHGATVAIGNLDADGEIVSRLRSCVGSEIPIIMTLDLHANISDRMVKGVTATILYRTTPHVDQLERGIEAAEMIVRTIKKEIEPVQSFERLPMLMNVIKHDTSEEPASILLHRLEQVLQRPKILSASIGYGFAHADVQEMGTSVIVVSDKIYEFANEGACWLSEKIWKMRDQFTGDILTPGESIRKAVTLDGQPIVVSDVGDNVGGGAPGNSTILLQEMLSQGVTNSLIVIWDPKRVEECISKGVGSEVILQVGSNSGSLPVAITGKVRTISDGKFFEPEPRHGGRSQNNQGLTVVVETLQKNTIVLTTLRMAPLSLQQILSLGINPKAKKIIIVKAVVAPRAAYKDVASNFILSGTPGATSVNFTLLNYKHRKKPLFPWELSAEYRSDN